MSLAATPGRYRRRPRDQQLLEVLVAGGTPEQAGAHAGVSRATVYRRLRHTGFLGELRLHQDHVLAHLRRRTVAATTQALDALCEIVTDETAPAAARVSAARTVLERADPTPARVEATVAVGPHPDDRSPKDQLNEALDRARERMGLPAYAGNSASGNGSDGDG